MNMLLSFGRVASLAVALGCTVAGSISSLALAQDVPIAKVNGKAITEADLAMADAEIGPELGQLPAPTKRRLLVEYVIENHIFADAAEAAKLGAGPAFEQRLAFLKRRALRDLYFETNVKNSVGDAEAKAFYDEQIKLIKPEEEVSARVRVTKVDRLTLMVRKD